MQAGLGAKVSSNPINNLSRETFDRLIGLKVVLAMCGFSKSTQQRLEKRGEFPARIRLSPGRVAWQESLILEFVHSRKRVDP